MGLFVNPRSPFWWMLLEGHGRKRESTRIRRDARAPTIRAQNRAAAEAIYHARMTQLARRRVGLPIESDETFAHWSTWYETHHTARHRGAARERYILTRLRGYFGAMPLADIRPARWTEYETARLTDGASVNTIGRELAVMKSVLVAAVGEHLDVSPLAHVKRRSVALPAKVTLTAADETRLLAELHDAEIRDLYLVGVGTLLRQANLVHLQRREHRGDRLVVTTKTGPHQIPLTGPTVLQRRAATVLRRRMPTPGEQYFFPRWHARFAANRDAGNAHLLKIVRRAVRRAGLRWGLKQHGVVWHTLTRATGATMLLRRYGLDVRTVQLIGGWRSLDQMAAYLGVDLAHPAGAVQAPRSRRHRVGTDRASQ